MVDADRDHAFVLCEESLGRAGFKTISASRSLWQIEGIYHRATVYGGLKVTLSPQGTDATVVALEATANVDNVYALFRSPTAHLLRIFKDALEEALTKMSEPPS